MFGLLVPECNPPIWPQAERQRCISHTKADTAMTARVVGRAGCVSTVTNDQYYAAVNRTWLRSQTSTNDPLLNLRARLSVAILAKGCSASRAIAQRRRTHRIQVNTHMAHQPQATFDEGESPDPQAASTSATDVADRNLIASASTCLDDMVDGSD